MRIDLLLILIRCKFAFTVCYFLNMHVLKRMVQTSNFEIIDEYICSSLPTLPPLFPPSHPTPLSLRSNGCMVLLPTTCITIQLHLVTARWLPTEFEELGSLAS